MSTPEEPTSRLSGTGVITFPVKPSDAGAMEPPEMWGASWLSWFKGTHDAPSLETSSAGCRVWFWTMLTTDCKARGPKTLPLARRTKRLSSPIASAGAPPASSGMALNVVRQCGQVVTSPCGGMLAAETSNSALQLLQEMIIRTPRSIWAVLPRADAQGSAGSTTSPPGYGGVHPILTGVTSQFNYFSEIGSPAAGRNQARAGMRSMPPKKGCSAAGMSTEPSSRWWFSSRAMSTRLTARAVPLSKWTKRGPALDSGR